MEKIERYLMNKFAKTQLHFKSKINIMSSASKHSKNKIEFLKQKTFYNFR